MLKHKLKITVNMPLSYCLKCVSDPAKFLSHSKYVVSARRIGENKYEILYKWVKWGITKYFRVVLSVERRGNEIIYRSTEESDYEHYFIFRFQETGDKKTVVEVESGMKAGFMANLLGRKDYRGFIEEIVEKGIVALSRQFAEKLSVKEGEAGEGASCRDCLLYDVSRGYCFALRVKVEDPGKPPCNYKYYLSRRRALEALEE